MIYLLIFIYMIFLPIAIITLLIKIMNMLNKKQDKVQLENRSKRIHHKIEKSNYDNSFGGRKAYEIYKNRDGLYEPITPSKGIELKKKEE